MVGGVVFLAVKRAGGEQITATDIIKIKRKGAFRLAQQESPITTQGKKKKVVSEEKKELRGREREREKQQKHFLVQRDKTHLGNCVCMCVHISVCVQLCTCHNQRGNVHHVGSPNIELGAEW